MSSSDDYSPEQPKEKISVKTHRRFREAPSEELPKGKFNKSKVWVYNLMLGLMAGGERLMG
ncbi:hypothetical protein HRbin17_02727 [bacterium HR17]|uniref:Uncharacterized protein n=1 Tax=Candidatus Fervidibacter japonicus TaxID=2035412 RepID=A0A2H5XG77_9BACT|nr:hypothetical protein HRbin17_02727 [bacterium HR17]